MLFKMMFMLGKIKSDRGNIWGGKDKQGTLMFF